MSAGQPEDYESVVKRKELSIECRVFHMILLLLVNFALVFEIGVPHNAVLLKH